MVSSPFPGNEANGTHKKCCRYFSESMERHFLHKNFYFFDSRFFSLVPLQNKKEERQAKDFCMEIQIGLLPSYRTKLKPKMYIFCRFQLHLSPHHPYLEIYTFIYNIFERTHTRIGTTNWISISSLCVLRETTHVIGNIYLFVMDFCYFVC